MPDAVTLALFGLVVLLLVVLVVLAARRQPAGPDETQLASHVAHSLRAAGLYEQIGEVKTRADDMRNAADTLDRLLRVQGARGAAGEFQLDAILGDLLPPDRYEIRTNVPGVGTPDACIRTRGGDLYIDAKFPLDAYRALVEASDAATAHEARKRFLRAVRDHIDAVASKYVGTGQAISFAILFVPSEAVFATALDMDPALLREASEEGVLLASPTTLAAHLSILAAGIQAETISARAQRIQQSLAALDRRFAALRSDWETLTRHVANAESNLSKVDGSLGELERAWQAAVEGGKGDQ